MIVSVANISGTLRIQDLVFSDDKELGWTRTVGYRNRRAHIEYE